MIRAEHRNVDFGPKATRSFSEQRGATYVIIVATAEDAAGLAAADTAIRAVRAARFIPALCRKPGFWVEMLEQIDTYLSTSAAGGECGLGVVGMMEDRILGAVAGDIGVWTLDATTTAELNPDRDADAYVGSALAEPIGFGPTPYTGTVLIGAPGLLLADHAAEMQVNVGNVDPFHALPDVAARAQRALAWVVCRTV